MNAAPHTSTVSRREFLAVGAAAAAVAGALTAPGRAPLLAAEASPRARLRFGLTTFMWGADWDLPTLLANCQAAGLYGLELRTCAKHAHGVEVTLTAGQRAEIRKRIADSPLRLVSLACSERMDWPQPERLREAIEAAKVHLQLSHDLGCGILRVFPNQFHPEVPHEQTIEQIARSVDELGATAAGLGQEVSLEAHGPAGELTTLRAVMDRVTQKTVRIRLNCDHRDGLDQAFRDNFALIQHFLSRAIHLHDLEDPLYPYQLMVDLLVQMKWEGCALMERSEKVPDRVAAMTQQRQLWETMIDKAAQGAGG